MSDVVRLDRLTRTGVHFTPRRSRMDEERRLKSDFESERGDLERQYKQRLQQVGGAVQAGGYGRYN